MAHADEQRGFAQTIPALVGASSGVLKPATKFTFAFEVDAYATSIESESSRTYV